MLGLFLLFFVILLMLLFVVASFIIFKQQKMGDKVENELEHIRESIIHLKDKKE
ncbi:hypothetical protein WAX74_08345 [Psychrobacillus sp. FJAT-51614]|uniref:DUF4083 domain-containing protein n=1 Tax=Psychrobacillus mangrovi TaxID=3117745 RepID=A0ABU8F3R1_9BACI